MKQEEEHRTQHMRGECACVTNFNLQRDYALAPYGQDVPERGTQERRLRPRPGGGRGRRQDREDRGIENSRGNGGQGPFIFPSQALNPHANAWVNDGYQASQEKTSSRGGLGNNFGENNITRGSDIQISPYMGTQNHNNQQQEQPVYVHESLLHSNPSGNDYEDSRLETQTPIPDSRMSENGSQSGYVGYRIRPDQPIEYVSNRYSQRHQDEAHDSQYHSEISPHGSEYHIHSNQPSSTNFYGMTPDGTYNDEYQLSAYSAAAGEHNASRYPHGTLSSSRPLNFSRASANPSHQYGETNISPLETNRTLTNTSMMQHGTEVMYTGNSTAMTYTGQQYPSSQFQPSTAGQNYNNYAPALQNKFQPYNHGFSGEVGMKFHPENSGSQQMALPAPPRQPLGNIGNQWHNPLIPPKAPRAMRRERNQQQRAQQRAQSKAMAAVSKQLSDLHIGEGSSAPSAGTLYRGEQRAQVDTSLDLGGEDDHLISVQQNLHQNDTAHQGGEPQADRKGEAWVMVDQNNGESSNQPKVPSFPNRHLDQESSALAGNHDQDKERGNGVGTTDSEGSGSGSGNGEGYEDVSSQPTVVSSSLHTRRGSA